VGVWEISESKGLIIWSLLSRRLVVVATTKPNLGHLAPASEVAGGHTDIPYHFKIGRPCPFKNSKVCLRATSEAGARWPIFSLVVATTSSRRDNKDQMIRP
jgi:hypothetical protein